MRSAAGVQRGNVDRTIAGAWAIALLGFGPPSHTFAAMTMGQMKALGGSAQLQSTAGRLLEKCGIPASITQEADAGEARGGVSWRGISMRLSAADWRIAYGSPPPESGRTVGWFNPGPSHRDCLPGAAWIVFNAKGGVGELIVRRKLDGSGFVTTYRVPDNLYQAHKVIGLKAGVVKRIPLSELNARYGAPDEVLDSPGGGRRYRYWVLKERDHRPEELFAADFEIDSDDRSGAYEISAAGADFVNQKLELLLRIWERDYVLD